MRSYIDMIVLSSLPHMLTPLYIFQAILNTQINLAGGVSGSNILSLYGFISGASSILSIAWHINREPYSYLFWLDYGFAGAWILIECVLSLLYTNNTDLFVYILFLNGVVFILNKLADNISYISKNCTYEPAHSYWHIVSAVKCLYVANLLVDG